MDEKPYQLVKLNRVLASAYQSVISGKPDCFDVVGEYATLEDAEKHVVWAERKHHDSIRIRLADDPNPNVVISGRYMIAPEREPELHRRVVAEWKREDEEFRKHLE